VAPTIRSARAQDADFIAATVLLAQRGHRPRGWFDLALDWPESRVLDFAKHIAVTRTISWWHTSQFLIAEVDDRPAAALCAMPVSGTRAAARSAIKEVAEDIVLDASELSAIFQRGAYSNACWIQGGDGDWLIEHVATQPAYRGRGLILRLMEHALAAGRAAGYARVSISFLIGNDAAEQCYAKAGFEFAEEKRNADFEALVGAPGFRRFARAI